MTATSPTSATTPSHSLSTTGTILRGAARRARFELRNQMLSWNSLGFILFPVVGFVVLLFLRHQGVRGSDVTLAQLGVPGVLALGLITNGVLAVAAQLLGEQDDGTLLRARLVPYGMISHLMGDVAVYLVAVRSPIAALLAVAAAAVEGVAPNGAGGWLRFLAVGALGLAATLPLGAALGAMLKSPALVGLLSLGVQGLALISGIFYPLDALPGWLATIGQVFPIYWVGIGFRSAMLDPAAVHLEVTGSWRTAEMVLGAWTAAGLLVAPAALRRMARRQSGSRVTAARDRIMSRGF